LSEVLFFSSVLLFVIPSLKRKTKVLFVKTYKHFNLNILILFILIRNIGKTYYKIRTRLFTLVLIRRLFSIPISLLNSSNTNSPHNTDTTSILTTSNFLELKNPGVYAIINKKKNMKYFGESQSILQRFEKHYRALEQQTHDNRPLQEDYLEAPSSFEFIVLDWGLEWVNVNKRVARQDYYIDLNKERTYNIFEFSSTTKCPILINGQRFGSVREAARATGMPRTTLRRYLRDPSKSEYSYLQEERVSYGKTPIFAKRHDTPSLLFESKLDAVQADFAPNKQNVTRKLYRSEPGWRYAHFDSQGIPLRIPYQVKPGEITYQQWLEQNGSSDPAT